VTTIGYRVQGVGVGCNGTSTLNAHAATPFVRLAIYDLLGREVAVLVNEKKDPGRYDATWNAAGVSSGAYVYRLQTGQKSIARILVLQK